MFRRKQKNNLIEVLKKVINNLEEDLKKEKAKNEICQKDMIILLNNSEEQRAKITDLENNIELLKNNLSKQNKELISDFNG